MNARELRLARSQQVIDTCLAMNAQGINQNNAGNVSLRVEHGFLITPSGLCYSELEPSDIVRVDLEGHCTHRLEPSSEWRMHLDIYRRYDDAGAVLHAHPTFATALSCLRLDIPAFHYMIAAAGGDRIRCSDYALFGTQELSDHMIAALEQRRACLLGTHGMICYHRDLPQVLRLGIEVETLARQYWHARQIGEPVILDDAQMAAVLARFESYGKQAVL